MPHYEPIPTPAILHWREFRVKALPILTFALTVVLCVSIWSRYVTPSAFLGQAVSAHATVSCPHPGVLLELNAELDQPIQTGQRLGYVRTSNPRVLESTLAVIRAETDLIRIGILVDVDRNQLNLERLQVDLLTERTDLATARIQREYAEAEFARVSALRNDPTQTVSQSQFDIAKRDRDAAVASVENRAATVQRLTEALDRYAAPDSPLQPGSRQEALRLAVESQRRRLELTEAQLGPFELTASAAGVVTAILRRPGETVTAGEPILTLVSTNITGIVTFVLQPSRFEAKPGMLAEISSRSGGRARAMARVERVGAYLAPIPLVLMSPAPVNNVTNLLGVPLWVSAPGELPLRPGEIVGVKVLVGD